MPPGNEGYDTVLELRKLGRQLKELDIACEKAAEQFVTVRVQRDTLRTEYSQLSATYEERFQSNSGEDDPETLTKPAVTRPLGSRKARRKGSRRVPIYQQIKEQPGITKNALKAKYPIWDSFFTRPIQEGHIRAEGGKCYLTPLGEEELALLAQL